MLLLRLGCSRTGIRPTRGLGGRVGKGSALLLLLPVLDLSQKGLSRLLLALLQLGEHGREGRCGRRVAGGLLLEMP